LRFKVANANQKQLKLLENIFRRVFACPSRLSVKKYFGIRRSEKKIHAGHYIAIAIKTMWKGLQRLQTSNFKLQTSNLKPQTSNL
jgi:hypothetical protein